MSLWVTHRKNTRTLLLERYLISFLVVCRVNINSAKTFQCMLWGEGFCFIWKTLKFVGEELSLCCFYCKMPCFQKKQCNEWIKNTKALKYWKYFKQKLPLLYRIMSPWAEHINGSYKAGILILFIDGIIYDKGCKVCVCLCSCSDLFVLNIEAYRKIRSVRWIWDVILHIKYSGTWYNLINLGEFLGLPCFYHWSWS